VVKRTCSLGLIMAMTTGGCGGVPGGAQREPAPPAATLPAATFVNPIRQHGADPWLAYVDGWYYLATTNDRDIRLRRAKRLADLRDASEELVWHDETPGRSLHFWAPEFHRLDDGTGRMRWYLYYTASGIEEPSHRMFVAESAGDDIRGPYAFKAKLLTDRDDNHYAIDGTVFDGPRGDRYFAWCGRPSETGQGLFLSRMTDPWTLVGDRIALKADGFGCTHVREGPVTLRRGGKIFMTYSMCGADTPDYRLGMLIADEAADLMDPASWKQNPEAVFTRDDAVRVYGPGHNFFFKSPDGTEDWIIYHAKTTARITYGDRATRAQKFTWSANGMPAFGKPLADDVKLAVPAGE
jgi:GH43 family beta-xylosidase